MYRATISIGMWSKHISKIQHNELEILKLMTDVNTMEWYSNSVNMLTDLR